MAGISRKALMTTTALAASFAAPAFADVTAEEVWSTWKEQMGVYDEDIVTIGSEEMSGDTLEVRDIKLEFTDGGDVIVATIDEVLLTENGDGTVSITMSEETPVSITSGGDTVPLTLRTVGLDLQVSGDPDAMNFDMTATSYGLEVAPGTYDDMVLNTASISMSGLSATYAVVAGALQDLDYAIAVDEITATGDFTEDGGPGYVKLAASIAGMTANADLTVPEDMDNSENPILDGLTMVAGYELGATSFSFDVDADGETGQGAVSFDGLAMATSILRDSFSTSGTLANPNVSMFGFEIPFPVEVSMSEIDYTLAGPWSKADSPQDAVMSVGLRDLVVNDLLWSLVDPAAILPRDPATVAIDLSAEVKPLFDFMDPMEQQQAAMADLPAELNSLSLNALEIRAAGAEVAGSGSFTFDNTDLETFDGVPRPEGSLKLSVNGANGLIDKLIEMGLLPQEQAMGARMMMGLFATPVGDDQLESVIEINDQGHVLANGQRLQ